MPTLYYAPDPIQSTQFIPGTNTPASGGQLFFYQGGTSTKVTVWKDNNGVTAWANPIVLDSGGNLPAGGEVWQQTAQPLKVVFAPSNDTDPPASPYWTKDNLHGLNDPALLPSASEWLTTITPTFISGSQANYSGDVRPTFTLGTRLKSLVTAGTSYGTITSAVFSAGSTAVGIDTTLSLALDAGLSSTFIALLQGDNTESVPLLQGGRMLFMDSSDNTKELGFDLSAIASSTNVLVAMNSSGVVVDRKGATGASLVLLAATTAASSATIDFVSQISALYDIYEIAFYNVNPTTLTNSLVARATLDNGTTFVSSNSYRTDSLQINGGASTVAFDGQNTTWIKLNDNLTQFSGGLNLCGKLTFQNPLDTINEKSFNIDTVYQQSGANSAMTKGGCMLNTSFAYNGLRLQFASGFISTGSFYLYGLKKS